MPQNRIRRCAASVFALCAVVLCAPTNASINKIFGVDVGFGFPQLFAVQTQFYALSRLQVGVSGGILPGGEGLVPVVRLPDQTSVFADGNPYTLSPSVSTLLFNVSPFVRWFPVKERNFYLQFMYSMMQTRHNISGPLKDSLGQEVPGASILGTVNLTQFMPTISMGHIFMSRMWFINLALGATFLSNLSTSTVVEANIPQALGGASGNAGPLANVASEIDARARETAEAYKRQFFLIPSIMFSMGFFL